jgi:NIMA (never in mitosis gene a)-related kinase
VPGHYSKDVSNLIAMMLQRDPAKRPSVHQLLKVPCIEMRITRFLQADVFKEEFAHTLLHN